MSVLIYKKMSDIMKEIGAIGKDQKNTAQGYRFRGIDQMLNSLHPILNKYEVFMTPRCVQESHQIIEVERSSGKKAIDKHVSIQMEYDFYTTDGSKVTVGPIPAEGLDSGDKSTNKALSAALKYALIQTFCVPTEDMAEADFDSPEIGKPIVKETKVEVAFGEQPKVEQTTQKKGFTRKPKEATQIVEPTKVQSDDGWQ